MTTLAPAGQTAAPKFPAAEARKALADEWNARAPQTEAEILDFYRVSEHLEDDLEAFHSKEERANWTEILVHIAKNVAGQDPNEPGKVGARLAVDIGSGTGSDLFALRQAGVDTVVGVEPNDKLRQRCAEAGYYMHSDVADAPIEIADLLSCFDVLEHVVDPEAFLSRIAQRAKVGTVFVETCATFDVGTPLHLKENRGWHPGHCLELHGWEKIGESGRVRVWRRTHTLPRATTGLIICAYRSVSLQTVSCILKLLDNQPIPDPFGWRVSLSGEAGINRSRSIMASRWLRETADEVFLMIDDDIIFEPGDAERLVEKCRNGYDVICAAYPVRDGGHLALRGYEKRFSFHQDAEPVEIRFASTGFIAVHRRVVETLAKQLPLCHENQAWAFWPMFDFRVVEDEDSGGHNYLSEDWNFSEMAKEAGFKVWLDPSIKLGHLGMVRFDIGNMSAIFKAVTGKESDTKTEVT